ncbi:hypothetical protein TIFTF001_003346 [Ficus carica]|uniref:Uncharacterized protein n=1 Tax=Ficus carica TaxID=3494 RepID=A0AA88DA90_FICCA|nr:hypothetical protein TIFTF001_003346 [Ficus carica]
MEDGNGHWSCVHESCWTPLDHPFSCATDFTMEYTRSKTLAEKAVLRYNEVENGKLEVFRSACAHEDVCRAHIFCMERQSMRGRFLCAVANPALKGIGLYFQENFPAYRIAKEYVYCWI